MFCCQEPSQPFIAIPTHQKLLYVFIYGSAIERFYDEQGNETEMVLMKAGSETSGVWIEQGRYHSLEATDEMGVVLETKAHRYNPNTTEQIL